MPYIIGFVSQKGGVGKSTLARATAVAMANGGARVRLCDLDVLQGSTLDWYRRRLQNSGRSLASVETYRNIADALKSGLGLQPAFDALVLDMPGRATLETHALALNAHLLVQPSSGALDDLDPGIRLFHELKTKGIPSSKMVFALSRVSTENERNAAQDYITRAGYTTLEGFIPDRAGYKSAQNTGLTIFETPFQSLNDRTETLLRTLFDYLTNLGKTRT